MLKGPPTAIPSNTIRCRRPQRYPNGLVKTAATGIDMYVGLHADPQQAAQIAAQFYTGFEHTGRRRAIIDLRQLAQPRRASADQ